MDPREVIFTEAIAALNNDVFTSVRACAKAFGVSRCTLTRRIAQQPTRSMGYQKQQRLSPEQEAFIAHC
jgi:DNA invertase Pin-like site-specific DNA recombinase